MKIVACTDLITKTFSVEEATKFFNLPTEEILKYVESGKPIPAGQRYWYVDVLRGDSD